MKNSVAVITKKSTPKRAITTSESRDRRIPEGISNQRRWIAEVVQPSLVEIFSSTLLGDIVE